MKLFSPIPVLVKLWVDRMEVTRLDNGQCERTEGRTSFSNSRIVVAHFVEAEDHLKTLMRVFFGKGWITPKIHVVVQQLERAEGGLSAVEQKAIVDLCEFAGASKVLIMEQADECSMAQALQALRHA